MEKKKNLIALITTALFLILLTVPTILYLTVGENTDEVLDEKRTLAELPAVFHNDYFRDLDKWYNDHAPYRMTLITFLLEQSQKYSAFYRNEIRPALSAMFTPAWYDDAYKEWTGLDLPYLVPMEDYLVTYGREDWLYYTGENSVGFFTGNNLLAPEEMEKWKEAFLALTDLCSKKGIRLVYMIPVNKEQVYPEYMASYHIENLPKREEIIYQYMKENGVPIIYPAEQLRSWKDKYRIYFQQDSHWTKIGAYIALEEVYKMLGMPVTPLEELKIIDTEKTGGDLSNFCGYATTYPDYEVVYKPEISYTTESYDDGIIEVFRSDSTNEHNLVLVGDSMRDYNKDFFARDFRNSTVFFRYKIGEPVVTRALLDLKEGDVLLLQIGERHDEAIFDVTNYLLDLLSAG